MFYCVLCHHQNVESIQMTTKSLIMLLLYKQYMLFSDSKIKLRGGGVMAAYGTGSLVFTDDVT